MILLMASLVNGCSLGDTVVMAAPDDVCALWEVQDAFDGFPMIGQWNPENAAGKLYAPNLDVTPAIILGPNAEDIFAAPDTQDDAAHLLSSFHELIANKRHEKLFPVAVGHAFLKSHDPLAAALVLLVFPDRAYAVLEDIVVADRRQT
jgi:hypothetical protein